MSASWLDLDLIKEGDGRSWATSPVRPLTPDHKALVTMQLAGQLLVFCYVVCPLFSC